MIKHVSSNKTMAECGGVLMSMLLSTFIGYTISSTTEFLCPKADTWTDVMTKCIQDGGTPLSREDLTTHNNVSLKNDTHIWTADYTALVAKDVVEKNSLGTDLGKSRQCAYSGIKVQPPNQNMTYFQLTNVRYGNCSIERGYICVLRFRYKGFNYTWKTIHLKGTTWENAKKDCESQGKILQEGIDHWPMSGYLTSDVSYDVNSSQARDSTIWLDDFRYLDVQTISSNSFWKVNWSNIIRYGTYSELDGFAFTPNQSQTYLMAVCRFEKLILGVQTGTEEKGFDNSSYSTDCFQEKGLTKVVHSEESSGNREETTWLTFIFIVSPVAFFVTTIGVILVCCYVKRRRIKSRSIINDNSARTANVDGVEINIGPTGADVIRDAETYVNGAEIHVGSVHAQAPSDSDFVYDLARDTYKSTLMADLLSGSDEYGPSVKVGGHGQKGAAASCGSSVYEADNVLESGPFEKNDIYDNTDCDATHYSSSMHVAGNDEERDRPRNGGQKGSLGNCGQKGRAFADDNVYDNKDCAGNRAQSLPENPHIYDRAIFFNGEALYDKAIDLVAPVSYPD